MIVYITNLTFITIIAMLSCANIKGKNETEKLLPNIGLSFLVILSLVLFFAIRWNVGTDFQNYYWAYNHYGNMNLIDILGIRDWLFYLISSMIYKLTSGNYLIYAFILGFIIYSPVVYIYRKYSINFAFTCFLYITTFCYYIPYNGTRQSVANSICFLAVCFLYKKRYIKYISCVCIAYLFHSTSLILIPMMLLVTKKSWSKPIIYSVVIILIISFILPNIWQYLINILEMLGQNKMVNDYGYFGDLRQGVSFFRILVAFVPVAISFIWYKPLKNIDDSIDLLINMSLLNAMFMLLASRVTLVARFSIYFNCFNALLIPHFIKLCSSKSRVLVCYIIGVLYLIYMCMLLPVDSHLLPYTFIFNK